MSQYHQKHLNNWHEFVSLLVMSSDTLLLQLDTSDSFLGYMYTDFGLSLLSMVSTTSNKAGSGWKIDPIQCKAVSSQGQELSHMITKHCHYYWPHRILLLGGVWYLDVPGKTYKIKPT